MSIAEIKAELAAMSLEQRLSLEEYLRVLNRIDDPQVQREVNEAMARMDAGQRVEEAEFERRLSEVEKSAR
jgi:uncharacterized protein YqgV (UPF0045/DUF77 family)